MSIFSEIPKEIIIGDEVYEVQLVKKPGNSKNLDGIIYYNEKIQVRSTLGEKALDSTFIHEVLHGISRHYALRLSEVSILKLEKGLFELFIKNEWKIVTE